MGLETATYVDGLNTSNPAATDGLAQADDHIRLIKSTIKNTFPNIDAPVTADPTELNILDGATVTTAEVNHLSGVTGAIQTQIDTKASTTSPTISDPTLTGTIDASAVDAESLTIGAFTISQGTDGRLDFVVGGTTVLSLDQSGNLRTIADVVGFDSTA